MTLKDGWLMIVERAAYDSFLADVRAGRLAGTGNMGSAAGSVAPPDRETARDIFAHFSSGSGGADRFIVRRVTVPTTWERDGVAKGFAGPVWYWLDLDEAGLDEAEVDEIDEAGENAAVAGNGYEVSFDGVSYACAAYLNGELLGTHRGIWDHFSFPLGALRPEKNHLLLEVHKPGGLFPVRRSLAGFIPYVTTTFGGPWQPIRTRRRPACRIEAVAIECERYLGADREGGTREDCAANVRFALVHNGRSAVAPSGQLTDGLRADVELWELPLRTERGEPVRVGGASMEFDVAAIGDTVVAPSTPQAEIRVSVGIRVPAPKYWSPAMPHLYSVRIRVSDPHGNVLADETVVSGLRTIDTGGRNNSTIELNGEPIFPRGLLNWCAYPDSFAPSIGADRIREEFRVARELGYNLIKLCLVVPDEEYFDLADREGMLLWMELPMWLPDIDEGYRDRARAEYRSIVRRLRHHPSILAWTIGCELGEDAGEEMLQELFTLVKEEGGARLVRDNSGSAEAYGGIDLDISDFYDYHFYTEANQFSGLLDHFYPKWRARKPLLFGEYCDSDTFRSIATVKRLAGGVSWWMSDDQIENPIGIRWDFSVVRNERALAAWPYSISFEEMSRRSRARSMEYRKDIIEKTRAREDTSGYVITGFRDTPLSTAGMIDDLGEIKFDASEFRTFNADTVFAVERRRRRIWRFGGDRAQHLDERVFFADEELTLDLVLSHRGANIGHASFGWTFGALNRHFEVDVGADFVGKLAEIVVHAGTFSPPDASTVKPAIEGPAAADTAVPDRTLAAAGAVAGDGGPHAQIQSVVLSATLLAGDGVVARSSWTFWFAARPNMEAWSFDLYDPADRFFGLAEAAPGVRIFTRANDLPAEVGRPIIATAWSETIPAWIEAGAGVVVAADDAPFLKRVPFWREAVPFFHDHPLAKRLPHNGYAGIQFKGVTPDASIDSGRLAAELGRERDDVEPVLSRYDARSFELTDYLVAVRCRGNTLIATTLRLAGGLPGLPAGIPANRLGTLLLDAFLTFLRTSRPG